MWARMQCEKQIRLSKNTLRPFAPFFWGFALLFSVVGCSLVGGTPGLNHASGFSSSAPDDWKQISQKDSDEAYALPSGSIVTLVSSCDHRSQAPLEALSNQLLIGSRNRKIYTRTAERIGSRDGLWTSSQVEVESTPIQLTFFVTKSADCVFDFSLMKKGDIPKGDTAEFRKYISTFQYGKN